MKQNATTYWSNPGNSYRRVGSCDYCMCSTMGRSLCILGLAGNSITIYYDLLNTPSACGGVKMRKRGLGGKQRVPPNINQVIIRFDTPSACPYFTNEMKPSEVMCFVASWH